MPKLYNTRKQRAAEVLNMLERGPAFDSPFHFGGSHEIAKEASEMFRLWCTTWIIPEIKDLIPELRERR